MVCAQPPSHVQLFVTLWTVTHQALLSMDFPSVNTDVGCHAFLQGIFLTQGLNLGILCLLHLHAASLPDCLGLNQLLYIFAGLVTSQWDGNGAYLIGL